MPDAVLAFDLNETLLDLSALDGPVADALGDAALRPVWFQRALQLVFVGMAVGEEVAFADAQRAALELVAAEAGRELPHDAFAAVAEAVRSLPAHPDVRPGLEALRTAGFRCVALTNSSAETAHEQVRSAGLADLFEDVLAAEEAGTLKPRAAAYALAAERTGVPLAEVRLVACHAWDVTGALAAGARAAFLRRHGATPSPLGAQPDVVADDVEDLARRLARGAVA